MTDCSETKVTISSTQEPVLLLVLQTQKVVISFQEDQAMTNCMEQKESKFSSEVLVMI